MISCYRMPALAAILSMATLGCSVFPQFSAKRDFVHSIPVSGPLTLKANTSNGDIEVVAYEGDKVELVAHLTAYGMTQEAADDLLTKIDPVCTFEDDVVTIAAIPKIPGARTSIELAIKVPSQCSVQLGTSNGTIVVSKTGSPVKAHSSNGDIRISQATAVIDAETSNGSLEITDCRSNIMASTSNGNVVIKRSELQGQNVVRTSNGNIRVGLVANAEQSLVFSASTSNGHIDCDLPVESTKSGKKSMEGVLFPSADGKKPEGNLVLSTSNGNIHLEKEAP